VELTNRDRTVVPARLARLPGYVLARAHVQAHARFQEVLEPLGLTPKSFGVLIVITESGPLSQAAVGETLLIDRTTMVSLVDDLQRAGYVERGRNATDRRVHSLRVTAVGEEALGAAERIACTLQDELLAGLSADEREQLSALLGRIAGLSGASSDRAPSADLG